MVCKLYGCGHGERRTAKDKNARAGRGSKGASLMNDAFRPIETNECQACPGISRGHDLLSPSLNASVALSAGNPAECGSREK